MSRTAHPGDADTVVEVEFRTESPTHPFVRGSAEASCTFDLAKMIPRQNGAHAEFFTVLGADADGIQRLVEDRDTVEAELLVEHEDATLVEFLVSGGCPARRLAELGALPQTVWARDGEGRIVADIPSTRDAPAVTEAFLAENPDLELVTKREKSALVPPFSNSGVRQTLRMHLTDRQLDVVQTAFEMGYYDWPRGCTGEDVAAALDISSATFAEHVRTAERKLLGVLFEQVGAAAPDLQ
ncbi:helix-turn-helix domain-containing protein [Halobacterium jilantaiense]|uniref:Predicted DNA binding protein, contains HTH domain n=1 Tax=Halobacterium jilantaiense TaxID=355548 RepID=A0A1I0MMD0_9EURY|nr:bacterio-opsin activator domain-containing protein [Halobacterium jilantaiense]SEV89671.1 Predicted DNA binding protein, contains HTH domain [Halobacterium jilantaiense]